MIRGQDKFLADLRPAVALFLNFSGIDYDNDPDAGIKLDQFIRHVQQILRRYDGVLLELTFGDKGSYLYAVFGAPIAHEDESARAVAAAKDLCALPEELDFVRSVRIGISRGRMRAGAYGSRNRLTYGVQGDEVNRAARLMEQAAPGQILVSERIVNAVRPRYRFISLGSIQVRGKQDAFAVFQVLGKEQFAPISGLHTDLFGRSKECALLSEKLDMLVTGKLSGVVAIEGEAGIGESRLVEYVQAQVRSSGIASLSGSGDAIEKTTPYFAWQSIFAQLFKINALPAENSLRREHVLSGLMAWAPPELIRLVPLLNAVLPLDFPDNELTQQLSGRVARREHPSIPLSGPATLRGDRFPGLVFGGCALAGFSFLGALSSCRPASASITSVIWRVRLSKRCRPRINLYCMQKIHLSFHWGRCGSRMYMRSSRTAWGSIPCLIR